MDNQNNNTINNKDKNNKNNSKNIQNNRHYDFDLIQPSISFHNKAFDYHH